MGHLSANHEPEGAHDAFPSASAPAPHGQGATDALLALQNTAGNASVNRLMIQREPLNFAPRATSPAGNALTGFETGLADLTPQHQAALAALAEQLNARPLVTGEYVTMVGFADRRGDEGENQVLGQRRADAARAHLRQLVTDEDTKQQIYAYSLGAPKDGPQADDPNLRKVEVTVTRRESRLPPPTPTDPLPKTQPFVYPPNPFLVPDKEHRVSPDKYVPEWLFKDLPRKPIPPTFMQELRELFNKPLPLRDIARVARRVAAIGGLHPDKTEDYLKDAFTKGGEQAAKGALAAIIELLAEEDSGPEDKKDPYGPEVEEPETAPPLTIPEHPLP